MSQHPAHTSTLSVCLGLSLAMLIPACGTSSDASEPATTDASSPVSTGTGGELAQVSGGTGVVIAGNADKLEPGTRLEPGQAISVGRGSLAEVRLDDGTVLRLNENSEMQLPGGDHPERVLLRSGELVVLASGKMNIKVGTNTEFLDLQAGEAQIVHSGEWRTYSVVYGNATLHGGDESIELGPGASIRAPLGDDATTRKPLVSLRPLEDTAWARSFDAAATMAETVPRGVGSLTARRAGSSVERQKLRLVDHRVNVNISGRIAHTEIEQAFHNDAPAVMEGIYRFPLPADGSISGLSLLVGKRWMGAAMVEKERGRRIFQSIVDETIPRDPALLHWEHGNIFKLRVFPIPGRGERRIRLSYTETLPVVGDNLRYRYPMSGSGATGTSIERFTFNVNVDRSELSDVQVANIATPMIDLDRRESGDKVELTTTAEQFLPAYDLGVDIPVPEAERKVYAESHLDRDGQAYFMLALKPDLELPRDDKPADYVFVLDRSHSTTPELWTTARGLVRAMAGTFKAADRFAVLACDTACDVTTGGLRAPDAGAIEAADQFLDRQDLGGASDVGEMLTTASELLRKTGSGSERVVVYLGDGTPTSGELAPDKLARLLRDPLEGVRVQAVALGSRADLMVLDSLVRHTGGDLVQADARDDLEGLVRELRLRAKVPVTREVTLSLPDGMVAVHPQRLPSLRPGDSLVVMGKLSRPVKGDVVLSARSSKGNVEQRFPVELGAKRAAQRDRSSHLPRSWAREEIGHLTATQGFDAKKEIVALSKHYTVLSRYTAMIVLENDAMYREFNVVRGGNKTDKWDGSLTPTENDNAAAPDGAVAEPEKEEQKAKDKGSEREPNATPPAADPAPTTATKSGGRSRDLFDGELSEDDRSRDFSEPVEADEESGFDFKDDADDAFPGASGSGRSSGNRGAPSSQPRPKPSAPAKKAKSKKSSRGMDIGPSDDPLAELGGSGGISKGGWHHRPRRRIRRLRVAKAPSTSNRALDQLERLLRGRDKDTSIRSAHGKLVRAALRAGNDNALSFAEAWAEADPDHGPAMRALADVLASKGKSEALRFYASAIEMSPFSRREHILLARAYASKGDFTRSCSHRRALVSIDPKKATHHAELARCLRRAGRIEMAKDAIRDGQARAKTGKKALVKLASEMDRSTFAPASFEAPLHSFPHLKATLTWAGNEDLDIAVLDRRGQRLSSFRPRKVLVREGPGRETLTMKNIGKPVVIEVTRVDSGEEQSQSPIRAELRVRTPDGSRTFPVTIAAGSERVARVSWSF